MSAPLFQFFPKTPTGSFTLPSAALGANRIIRVFVQGVRVPFRWTSATAFTLASNADAGTIVSVYEVWEEMGSRSVAQASLDFPSIAANSAADLTMACPGAAVGDVVSIGMNVFPAQGIVLSARVSAANVVQIRATNVTAAAIDPTAIIVRATVLKD